MFPEPEKSFSRSRASAANSWVVWLVNPKSGIFRGSTGQCPTPYSLMDPHLFSMSWELVEDQLVLFSCAGWMGPLRCHWDRVAEVPEESCHPTGNGPSLLVAASQVK